MANLFSNVTSLFDLWSSRGERSATGQAVGNFFIATTGITNSGENIDVDNLLEDATIISGVNAITGGISQIPMQVRRKLADGGSEIVQNHPVTAVMKKPNAYQTPSEFKKTIVTSLLVHGNSYIKIVRVGGKATQLYPLDASEMTIGSNGMGFPVYSHDSYGEIPMDDIIHIRDVCTYAPQGGSRLLHAAERIGALRAADRQMATTFRNGVNIGYVATTDSQADADQTAAFQKAMSERYGKNGTNQGGVTLLPSGSTITAVKGSTPADTDLRALRQDMIREIAAVFGVPAYMLGTSGDEKYNNVRQKLASFHRDTLNPIMVGIQEAFTLKLLGADEYVHFDVMDFVKGAINEQVQVAAQAVQSGLYSVNEGREYLEMNPIQGLGPDGFDYDLPIPPNSSSTATESVSEIVEDGSGGEDGPQSLENRPERGEDG